MNPVYRLIAAGVVWLGGPNLLDPEIELFLDQKKAFEEVNRRIDAEWEKVLLKYPPQLLPPPPPKPMKP